MAFSIPFTRPNLKKSVVERSRKAVFFNVEEHAIYELHTRVHDMILAVHKTDLHTETATELWYHHYIMLVAVPEAFTRFA